MRGGVGAVAVGGGDEAGDRGRRGVEVGEGGEIEVGVVGDVGEGMGRGEVVELAGRS